MDLHSSRIIEITQKVFEANISAGTKSQPTLAFQVAQYVDKCFIKGVATTDNELEQCARRYLIGKRKVSAPFAKTRKRAKIKVRKERQNVPKEVLDQIGYVLTLPQARIINDKTVNALVGLVLKKVKFNPQIVKELLLASQVK